VKRLAALACLAAFALPVQADEEVGASGTAPALPTAAGTAEAATVMGYAFDQPELLADQHLWGIVHGVRLLTLACARQGFNAAAEAGVEWQEREISQIRALNGALSRIYFQSDDAPPDAIAAVLGLKLELDLAEDVLKPACETLAAALAQPRYDLARRREEILKK
jgi:hypothetical protein